MPRSPRSRTILSPAGLRPTLEGRFDREPGARWRCRWPLSLHALDPNFADPRAIDINTIETLISRPRLRQQHIARHQRLASYNNFDGVFIDYRGLSPGIALTLLLFISELAASLSERDLRLGLSSRQNADADGAWRSAAYDWRRIGEAADYFQLSALINPLSYMPDEQAQ